MWNLLEEGTLNRTRAAGIPMSVSLTNATLYSRPKGQRFADITTETSQLQSTGLLPNANPSDAGMGGLAAGAIAAIAVVLASVTAAAVAVLMYYWLRRKRRQRREGPIPSCSSNDGKDARYINTSASNRCLRLLCVNLHVHPACFRNCSTSHIACLPASHSIWCALHRHRCLMAGQVFTT